MVRKSSISSFQLQELLQRLIDKLVDVYDAHFVCETIASEVAAHTSVTTLVGLSDPLRQHYDIWICQHDGELTQHRWLTDKVSFELFIEAERAIRLEKIDQPVSEIINSDLWLLPREEILGVALPRVSSENQVTPPGVLCLIDPSDKISLDSSWLDDLAQSMSVYIDRAYLRLRLGPASH